MNNLDALFIRACKSTNPEKRVRSVYRRFYINTDHPIGNISYLLTKLVDTYLDVSVMSLVEMLGPSNHFKYQNAEDTGTNPDEVYVTLVMRVMISKIRLSEVSCFLGLPTPLMFKD